MAFWTDAGIFVGVVATVVAPVAQFPGHDAAVVGPAAELPVSTAARFCRTDQQRILRWLRLRFHCDNVLNHVTPTRWLYRVNHKALFIVPDPTQLNLNAWSVERS